MIKKYLKKFNIDKKEIKLILICLTVITIISSLWLIYGWLNKPSGYYFLGINFISPGDNYVYFSYLEQIKQNNWLLRDLYTSEQQNYTLNIFWLTIGLFAKIFQLPNLVIYQLARIVFIPIFLFSVYFFISYFFSEKINPLTDDIGVGIKRKICFIFLVSSSGLGALLSSRLFPFYSISRGYVNWPMDLWAAEANTFLTLYQSPLKIASLTLIILIFLLFLLAIEKNNFKYSFLAGIVGLFLIQFHPFHAATIFSVLFIFLIYLFLKNKKIKDLFKHFFLFSFLSSPAVIYYWYLSNFDLATKIKYQQNLCLTPSLGMTLISYGLLIPLAIAGLLYFIRIKFWHDEKKSFLVIWLIIQSVLIYSPLPFQRRLTEGLHVIIVIMAVYGLFYLYNKLKDIYNQKLKLLIKRYYIVLIFIYIIFFSLSNLSIIGVDIELIHSQEPWFYFSKNKVSALKWLKDNSEPKQKIFTSPLNGNFIPGLIARTVYAGHEVETLFFEQKKEKIEWFFRNNEENNEKAEFLRKNQLDYIFYSNEERKLGSFRPNEKKFLHLLYQNPGVEIYQVIN